MNLSKIKAATISTLLLGGATAAQAGFVTINDVSPVTNTVDVVPQNDFKAKFASLGVTQYTLGTSLGTDSAGSVSYYYYGKEAGYNNLFKAGSLSYETGYNSTWQDNFSKPILIGSTDVLGGLLDFRFCAFSSPGVSQGCVTNAQNDALSFGSWQSIAYSTFGNIAWLFWDDSGAGPDDNHDDMLIKAVFTAKAVPEPATLGLFGLGLMGMWMGSRRRTRKA